MIEFRREKGPWYCDDDAEECLRRAAAIVEDERWWFVAACDNEQHIAEALAEHERRKHDDGPDILWAPVLWADVASGPRFDGATWDTEEL